MSSVLALLLLGASAVGPTIFGQEELAPDGLKLAFPDVEGWERLATRPLPPESGGYSIGYNSTGRTTVTLYVYNRGLAKIANDLSNESVQREWTAARDALLQAKKLGFYEAVREETAGESTLGGRKEGRKALHARFRVTVKKEESLSDIYVLPYRNHFIKVRMTRPVDSGEAEKAAIEKLFVKLEELLGK